MDVVALLSDHLLSTLRAVLRNEHHIMALPPLGGLVAGLEEVEADVIVLEPPTVPPSQWPELLTFLQRAGTPTVVVYTSITPPAMRATVELARLGVRHIVLKGYDDSPRHFRALFDALATEFWVSPLYQRLEARCRPLPPRIRDAVGFLFRAPHRVRDVAGLAGAAGVAPRTLHRRLTGAGIVSPKRLVASAHVEWGLAQLRTGTLQVREVATRLGYPTARGFRREAQLLTGLPPAALTRCIAGDPLVDVLYAGLRLVD